jgi:sigma-B regulation protein RsbU (phosphoserine phosphatase)
MALENERIQHELELASQIQQRFLPQRIPTLQHFVIHGHMWPALEVGGDYYDIFEYGGKKMYICIGDVSGKGVGAGLIMVMARTTLHSLVKTAQSPACSDILLQVNNMVYENTGGGIFMSMLLMQIDLITNTITYSSAGHEHIIIYRAKKRCCEKILSGGLVLGLREHQEYQEHKLTLDPGDKLVLYTDGVTEAENPERQQFGLDALVALVGKLYSLSSKDLCDQIFQHVKGYMQSQKQLDDITLLAIDRLASGKYWD